MPRHAQAGKRGLAATIASTLSIGSLIAIGVGISSASATTYDLDGATLSFNKAKEDIGGAGLSVEGTQPDGRNDVVSFGYGMEVNDYINYYDVASIGGVDIDARLTFISEVGMESVDASDNGKIRVVDSPTSSTGENSRIRTSLYFDAETGDEYAEIKLEFFTNIEDSPNADGDGDTGEVAVTLQNVNMSVYDIDSFQYFEVTTPDRYRYGSPTILATPTDVGGGTRKRYAETAGTSSSSWKMNSRVTVGWDSISVINFRLGQDVPGGSSESSASYALDFSPGDPWESTITFDANYGGGSSSNSVLERGILSLPANSFTRSGFTFAGWNTSADGSGTAYSDGGTFELDENDTLYAQWTVGPDPAPAQPAPYSGPLPVKLVPSLVPSGVENSVTLEGQRLSGVASAEVDGKTVTVLSASNESVSLVLPSLAEGTYDVKYFSSLGAITHQDSVVVRGSAAAVSETPPTRTGFYASKRFTNYLGDRGGVVGVDAESIAKFINANPGITHVTCVGSTSGVPALATDKALAQARAENACGIVETLVPGVKVRYNASTGLGVGQWYRAVSMFVKGTN